jgi:hypothetical protein
MIPLITLGDIHRQKPEGAMWVKLLVALGGPDMPFSTRVSLGDIAFSAGAEDALWCIRALTWRDLAIRRAVVGRCVLPAVRRAAVHAQGRLIYDCITFLDAWCYGKDVDLQAAKDAAADASNKAILDARYAKDAAYMAKISGDARAALVNSKKADAPCAAAHAARAFERAAEAALSDDSGEAAKVAASAVWYALEACPRDRDAAAQAARQDIITASPLWALAKKETAA